ncbi:MAG: gliding motility-associated ABC transporter substrate-binding protein GldG [Bacteroidetes bacterium]|nr:gliding motility-associated ABC transporter substrate-binding protein GldG [Bacteroidota bacterium]
MVKWSQRKWSDVLWLANGLVLAVVLNQLASLYFFRLDLTEEKRYSIKAQTKELLQGLDDDVYVEVFLEGDLNSGFRRLRKAIRETLEEFRIYSNNKVHYTFTNPSTAAGKKAQQEFMASLSAKGIQPMNVIENKDGKRTEKLVFPGALVSYGGAETGVMLLKGNRTQSSQEVLNQSVEGIEFEIANAIHKLSATRRKQIGWMTGHGEGEGPTTAGIRSALLDSYDVRMVSLDEESRLNKYDVLILAKPTRAFSERHKYLLDQYLLHGGKLLWFVDELEVNMDSVSTDNYFAIPYKLNIEDQLFRYGVRINMDLVQDRVSLLSPVVTGSLNGQPQITTMEWPLFPMVNQYADHPVTRNLDAIALHFASSMDTVKAPGVKRTPLIFSSPYSRKTAAPVKVSINDLRKEMKPENFQSGPYVMGYLLEGKFTSLYRNRFLPEGVDSAGFRKEGESRMIVVSDGDLVRNEVNPRTGQTQELGFDSYSGRTFANKDLVMNMVDWLADDTGLINLRVKEVKIRPLDKEKITTQKSTWQLLNVAGPVLVIILLGWVKAWIRRKVYTQFEVSER